MLNYKRQIVSLGIRVFVSGIGFLVSVLLVRIYDKNIVGEYFIIVSLSHLLAGGLLIGMGPRINVYLAHKHSLVDVLKGVMRKISFTLPIIILISYFLAKYIDIEILLIILPAIGLGSLLLLSECFRGQGDYIFGQLFSGGISNLIFILLLVFLSVFCTGDIYLIIYSWFLSLLSATVLGFWILKIRQKKIGEQKGKGIIFKLDVILPIYFSSLIVYCFSQIDLWVVSDIFSIEDVAVYGLAIRLSLLITFSLMSVRAIAAAKIPELFFNHKERLQTEITENCRFTLVISVIIFLVLLLLGEEGIKLIFGQDYESVFPILLIFSLGQIVNSATGPCDYLLSHTRNGELLLKISFISFFILVVLLYGLVFFKLENLLFFALVVTISISFQNIAIVTMVYKKTGLLCLPLNRKKEK